MRICVVGQFYPEAFSLHIAETLAEMGHRVSCFDPRPRGGPASGKLHYRWIQISDHLQSSMDKLAALRRRRVRRLETLVRKEAVELVLCCSDFLWPGEVGRLREATRAKVVLWFPDALSNLRPGYALNAFYDGIFFKDPYAVFRFRDVLESPVYYLPEAFNPRRHRWPEDKPIAPIYRCDITTAGNLHAWRAAILKHLVHYDVKVWGNPAPLWMGSGPSDQMYQGRYVCYEEKAQAFLGAKIVLNSLHFSEIWGVNVRTFEAAGVGAFQLVDWRPGLSQLFEEGKEIVSFHCLADLQAKISYYLIQEEERQRIAWAGKVRAHREHRYECRLQLLLDTVQGKSEGYQMPNPSPSA